jgi:AbrB family looped-hinge helix DNA binding protein
MVSSDFISCIDEDGKMIIPKEVRRCLSIKNGDAIEFYVGEKNSLCMRKYSYTLIRDLVKIAGEFEKYGNIEFAKKIRDLELDFLRNS